MSDSNGSISEEPSFSEELRDLGLGDCSSANPAQEDVNDVLIAHCDNQLLLTADFEASDDLSGDPTLASTEELATEGMIIDDSNNDSNTEEFSKAIVNAEISKRSQSGLIDFQMEVEGEKGPSNIKTEAGESSSNIEMDMDAAETPFKGIFDSDNDGNMQDDATMGAAFDLDALFFDSENITDLAEVDTRDESKFPSHESIFAPFKRSLTPPNEEGDLPSAKRQKSAESDCTKASGFHFPAPQTVVMSPSNPIETLTPDSSTMPSPECDFTPTVLYKQQVPHSQILKSIQELKCVILPAKTLLTAYNNLKQASSANTTGLTEASKHLAEANQWRFVLADQNARLRSQVQVVTREKECLKTAIAKLHCGTNGLKKNEKLMMEIEERNLEIVRL